jgi:hypothetical protein
MSFMDLGATSNAVAGPKAVQPFGRERFGPSGGVARSLQNAAAMLLARALPSGRKPLSRGQSLFMRRLLGGVAFAPLLFMALARAK